MFQLKEVKQQGHARRGELTTPHGVVQTPVFIRLKLKHFTTVQALQALLFLIV